MSDETTADINAADSFHDLRFIGAGEEVVRVEVDGTVTVNPKYSTTDAAKAFWAAVNAESTRRLALLEAAAACDFWSELDIKRARTHGEIDREAWLLRASERHLTADQIRRVADGGSWDIEGNKSLDRRLREKAAMEAMSK